jgi:hypothetical protein
MADETQLPMAYIVDQIQTFARNFLKNVIDTFGSLTIEKYIRLVVIVGAYMLLRPYVMKLGAKVQGREHEKEVDTEELEKAPALTANGIRGQVEIPDDSDDEEGEGEATGADWGKKARRRQRQLVKKLLEAEEQRRRELQEDDEDKDIQEFLVD